MSDLVSYLQLKQLGLEITSIDSFYFYLNECLKKHKINSPLRLAHFFTQLIHESNKLKNYETSEMMGRQYEGRQDLGNVSSGDGIKYKPRGLFPLCGRNAYLAYSKYSGIPVLLNPSLLLTPQTLCDSACWYWSTYIRDEDGITLNELSDYDWFLKIIYLVDGHKYKSIKNKITTLKKCYEIFDVPKRSSRLLELYNQCKTTIHSTKNKQLMTKQEIALKNLIVNEHMLNITFKDIVPNIK